MHGTSKIIDTFEMYQDAGGAIEEHIKSLLLVLVKSHNLVFSVEDIMIR